MRAWALLLAPGLPDALGKQDQGLLVAAVDGLGRSVTVVGCVPLAAGADYRSAAEAVEALLPQGLAVVGSFSAGSSASISSWKPAGAAQGSLPAVSAANTAAAPGGGVQWTLNGQPATPETAVAAAAAADADASADDASLAAVVPGFVPLRCHLDVRLQVLQPAAASSAGSGSKGSNASSSSLPSPDAVRAAFAELSGSLLTQQLVLISELDGSAQQAAPAVIVSSSSSSKATVAEALAASSSSSNPCCSLLPLQHTTSSPSGNKPAAPMFEFEPAAPAASKSSSSSSQQQQQQLVPVVLSLDVLCFAPASQPLREVVIHQLRPALQQQLDRMMQQLLQQLAPATAPGAAAGQQQQQQQLVPAVRAHHFLAGLPFPVTVCYPQLHANAETSELKLMPMRQQLHQLLGLPDNVPMLRASNALAWAVGEAAAGEAGSAGGSRAVRLRNVHAALTPPGFGGQVHLVDGAYEYYHYMQDKFNDNGWGCAYRSLQTIISWFRLQKYTGKPVPGHRQIQEVLVRLGDKEPSFVGSSNWIGAIELSYILDELLGITCKVLTVNRGSDIPGQARSLAQHFATQGTPVMIGGGVLAYTLLGVAFNEDTGEAAFLILDPHYTGGEDLKKITQGTWVAWKQPGDNAAAGGPLFVKDAFYNFLCPQRPRTV